MITIPLTEEQLRERREAMDIIHAQHHHNLKGIIKLFQNDPLLRDLPPCKEKEAFKQAVAASNRLEQYFADLLPSKGFWGRVAARLSIENRDLKAQLEQQKFNNAHNLSIDQKVADKITSLEAQVKELEEYKWKYEDLCK